MMCLHFYLQKKQGRTLETPSVTSIIVYYIVFVFNFEVVQILQHSDIMWFSKTPPPL